MNKSLLVGAVLGAVGVTAGGAVATYSLVKSGPEYAQVLAVQPVKTQIKTPREVCKDVAVTRQKPVQDQHQIVGTVVGALAGGVAPAGDGFRHGVGRCLVGSAQSGICHGVSWVGASSAAMAMCIVL